MTYVHKIQKSQVGGHDFVENLKGSHGFGVYFNFIKKNIFYEVVLFYAVQNKSYPLRLCVHL